MYSGPAWNDHVVVCELQDDEADEMLEFDGNGMRPMSVALGFMCMLTVTQVFQVMHCHCRVSLPCTVTS